MSQEPAPSPKDQRQPPPPKPHTREEMDKMAEAFGGGGKLMPVKASRSRKRTRKLSRREREFQEWQHQRMVDEHNYLEEMYDSDEVVVLTGKENLTKTLEEWDVRIKKEELQFRIKQGGLRGLIARIFRR